MTSAEQPGGETEPLPDGAAGVEAAGEPRTDSAQAATGAASWPPLDAYQLPQAGAGAHDAAGDEMIAAAVLKAPPEGPFPTAPPQPEVSARRRVHVPALSVFSPPMRRRAALVGAPLLLCGAVGGSLVASGAFAGAPQVRGTGGSGAQNSSRSGQLTGLGSLAGGIPGSQSPGSGGSSAPSASPMLSAGAAPGNASPGHGDGGTTLVGSSSTTTGAPGTTGGGGGGGATTPAGSTTTTPPAKTDTGWVCRVGGFKVNGALSENPCVRDDNGTLMLEGELKGTYASSVVVVVRVDFGGTLSSANISKPVTPSSLGGNTFVYEVSLGHWPAGEEITCQENVDPAANPKDYQYTANSGDIRTFS